MSAVKVRALGFLTCLLPLLTWLLWPTTTQATRPLALPPPAHAAWTNWSGSQFALVDDGHSIWIAGAGSVLQWDKATGATQRFGPTYGLRHSVVLAAAIDSDGNRWFGGDAGLSRLSPDGVWTHFDSGNSALTTDYIDGIAVSPNGDLWLSHGLPNGAITRWQDKVNAQRYPDRESAVEQQYDAIKQTLNASDLWAISGEEIWVGYQAYDGASWHDRHPAEANNWPLAVRADSGGVWALEERTVFRWDGAAWQTYNLWLEFDGYATALAVGPDNSAWVGAEERDGIPYVNRTAGIVRLPETPGDVELGPTLGLQGPVAGLLPTADGPWAVGPAWLHEPNGDVVHFTDMPRFENITEVIHTTDDTLFVHSLYAAPYAWGTFQTLDDQGTTMLEDDQWQSSTDFPVLTAVETLPDGGMWIVGDEGGRMGFTTAGPFRYFEGSWYEYNLPFSGYHIDAVFRDIFVEDVQHTWFVYNSYYQVDRGVLRLDDGGTPADQSDDIWTDYAVPWEGESYAVAVDAMDRLWLGDDSGLHRYDEDSESWQLVNQPLHVCHIMPAADGTVFVHRAGHCGEPTRYVHNVFVIRPDGTQEQIPTATLINSEFDRVSTATDRNWLWTVAPDGAIWYLEQEPEIRLARHDGAHVRYYDLPPSFAENPYPDGPLEIDANNHVWFVNTGQLWRLSTMPDFGLDPQVWLIAPGSSRHNTISVRSIGGYDEPVTLELSGLPPGVIATFATNPVPAGEATRLILTADPSLALGAYDGALSGRAGHLSHSAPVTLRVVPTVYDRYFPRTAVP